MYYGYGYGYGMDPMYILVIIAFIFSMVAQSKVSTTFKKYSRVRNRAGFTGAQVATQIEHCVVILQGKHTQILFQFLESVTNFFGIALMGFCVGPVELIQHRPTIGIAGVKGMDFYIGL